MFKTDIILLIIMQNTINKKTVIDSHIRIKDNTLGQNTCVSHDFEGKLDFSDITSSLSHMKIEESTHWSKFKRRVTKLKNEDEKIRVVCGPVFRPKGQVLQYFIEEEIPVPTDFFALIIKKGVTESYLLPNEDSGDNPSLKEFRETVKKVQAVSGLVFGKTTFSIDQTPNPKASVVLHKKYFDILYNPRARQPYLTVHKISRKSLKGKVKRKCFEKENDPNLANFPVGHGHYKKSGLHKGHSVPAEDCKASPTKMKDSFTYANTYPQYPNFNTSRWRRLETYSHKVVRQLPNAHDEATVISGPLFLPEDGTNMVSRPLMGDSPIPIASHFFKVIHTEKETKAFVLSHNNLKFKGKTEKLVKDVAVSITKLKDISGIDFDPLLQSPLLPNEGLN